MTHLLLFTNATDTPLSSVQKEEYDASKPQYPIGAEDDITIISNPNVADKRKEDVVTNKQSPSKVKPARKKRGRPRKTNTTADTVEQEIATQITTGTPNGKRKRKPSILTTSPYKT